MLWKEAIPAHEVISGATYIHLLLPLRKIEICDKPCQLDEPTENYKQQEKQLKYAELKMSKISKIFFLSFTNHQCLWME